jgi:eukaryotic-like serine/threonine-protein kinase
MPTSTGRTPVPPAESARATSSSPDATEPGTPKGDQTVGKGAIPEFTTRRADDFQSAASAMAAARSGGSVAGRSFGDYELVKPIAAGGMGIVYLARQKSLRRLVALKMILAENLASPEDKQRFRKEAEAAAQLDHKGIVPIFEVGEHEGRPFFSMAYIEGGNLAARLRDGPMPCEQAAAIVLEVTEAVAYAHQHGVIHRDLKPSNVLLDMDGHTRVADFGLAKLADGLSHLTLSGQVLGTPTYMAPEQAAGKAHAVGPAADLYSLGAVLYCLVTGRPPFQAATPIETLRQVVEQEPVSLRYLNGAVSRDLDTICRKCLQKEPAKRYPSAAALAGDLRRFLSGEPIKARPVGSIERLWRWCRRNPSIAGLTGGILVSLVMGIVAASYYAIQAQQKATAALASELKAKEAREQSERRRYGAEIQLAAQDLVNSEVPSVQQRLSALKPQDTAELDLRGFEWYFLDRLCHLEMRTLRGHDEPVRCVAFGRDGRELATAGGQWERGKPGTIRIWNVASGECLRTLTGHTECVHCIAYSPDGRWLASSAAYPTSRTVEVKLWDAASGREIRSLLADNPVWSLSFSPDGRSLAGGSGLYSDLGQDLEGEVLVWDLTGTMPVRRLQGHEKVVRCVAFSPDGAWLASADTRGVVKIRKLPDWTHTRTLLEHTGQVMSLAFSPDSLRFAVATLDERTRIWDTAAWTLEQSTPYFPRFTITDPSRLNSLVFSPDGQRLAAGYLDRSIRIWEIATGREVLALKGHEREVLAVAFSPDGWRLASASLDQTIKIWDATTDRKTLPLHDHDANPRLASSFAFSRDGRKLASASADLAIRIWDVENAFVVHTLRGHTDAINDIAFSADGHWLVSASSDRSVRVWDADKAELVRTLPKFPFAMSGAAFAPGGRWLACAGHGRETTGGVFLWEFPVGQRAMPLEANHGSSAGRGYNKVGFSPDGQWLAGGCEDGSIDIWNTSFSNPARTLRGNSRAVIGAAFSPDSRALASASNDGSVRLWDVALGKLLATMPGHIDGLLSVAFTPEGRRLITGGSSHAITFWDFRTAQEVFSLPVPWSNARFACHPDGRRLLVGSGGWVNPDYSLAIWDARTMTDELRDQDEARSRVAYWYGRLPDRDQVRDKLTADPALAEPVRRRALALVEEFGRSIALRRAEDLLAQLVAKGMLVHEILEHLRNEAGLDESVRREALALGVSLVENTHTLDRSSRSVVSRPGATPAAYQRALTQAETASRIAPHEADYQTTLGMALYRTGDYRGAIAALARVDEPGGANPPALAFTAMAQYQLGQLGAAEEALKRLGKLVKDPPGSSEQAKAFFREAERLIERKSSASGGLSKSP